MAREEGATESNKTILSQIGILLYNPKMTNDNHKISLVDVQNFDLESVFASSEHATCESYSSAFLKSGSSFGESAAAIVAYFFASITSFHFVVENPNEPFRSMMVYGDRRSMIPVDLVGDQWKVPSLSTT